MWEQPSGGSVKSTADHKMAYYTVKENFLKAINYKTAGFSCFWRKLSSSFAILKPHERQAEDRRTVKLRRKDQKLVWAAVPMNSVSL